jgi:hypothetical protein
MDYKQWALKGKAGLKSATTILSINLNLLRNDANTSDKRLSISSTRIKHSVQAFSPPCMWNDRVVVRGRWRTELAELNDADKYTGRIRQTNTHGGVADSAAMHRS